MGERDWHVVGEGGIEALMVEGTMIRVAAIRTPFSTNEQLGEDTFDMIAAELLEDGVIDPDTRKITLVGDHCIPVFVYLEPDEPERTLATKTFYVWNSCPHADVLLDGLARAIQAGRTIPPLVVVDAGTDLRAYGENAPPDPVESFDDNPCPELERYIAKEYDGALGLEELRPFVGSLFGGMNMQGYRVNLVYHGRIIEETGATYRPQAGAEAQVDGSVFVINRVHHRRFGTIPFHDLIKDPVPSFAQFLDADLRYVRFDLDRCVFLRD